MAVYLDKPHVEPVGRVENVPLTFYGCRMKRDPDLIREILLAVEASDKGELLKLPPMPGHTPEAVHFHVRLLLEAGLLQTAMPNRTPKQDWIVLRLSWFGYDFLDHVRDPKIWRVTKAGAGKIGSWSLETLSALAKGAILAKAATFGLPLS